jgi:hypothetical protein
MRRLLFPLLALTALTSGCAFHSTASHWNGRVGPNGEPVFVKSTSSVGFNLFVLIKLVGGTNIDGMIHEMTGNIAAEGGDRVRVIQSSTENYWYGFPPFTWIVTPVITTVAADYEPSAEQLAEAATSEVEDD